MKVSLLKAFNVFFDLCVSLLLTPIRKSSHSGHTSFVGSFHHLIQTGTVLHVLRNAFMRSDKIFCFFIINDFSFARHGCSQCISCASRIRLSPLSRVDVLPNILVEVCQGISQYGAPTGVPCTLVNTHSSGKAASGISLSAGKRSINSFGDSDEIS